MLVCWVVILCCRLRSVIRLLFICCYLDMVCGLVMWFICRLIGYVVIVWCVCILWLRWCCSWFIRCGWGLNVLVYILLWIRCVWILLVILVWYCCFLLLRWWCRNWWWLVCLLLLYLVMKLLVGVIGKWKDLCVWFVVVCICVLLLKWEYWDLNVRILDVVRNVLRFCLMCLCDVVGFGEFFVLFEEDDWVEGLGFVVVFYLLCDEDIFVGVFV